MNDTVTRLLQRQILPLDRDFDVLALYVDPEEPRLDADREAIGGNRAAKALNNAAIRQSTATGAAFHPDQIESRTAFRVRSGEKLSFGTYFNAFPASYWRRWTIVDDVTLTVEVKGRGATVIVYKSMARGHSQRVAAESTDHAEHRSLHVRPARSSRSSTAAGTGTTWWQATTTCWCRRPSGPPRSRPTAPSTAPSTWRSRP